MKPAEALLPHTRALKCSTVEFEHHAGKILVRYRDPRGYVVREHFTDPNKAHKFFLAQVEKLHAEIHT